MYDKKILLQILLTYFLTVLIVLQSSEKVGVNSHENSHHRSVRIKEDFSVFPEGCLCLPNTVIVHNQNYKTSITFFVINDHIIEVKMAQTYFLDFKLRKLFVGERFLSIENEH